MKFPLESIRLEGKYNLFHTFMKGIVFRISIRPIRFVYFIYFSFFASGFVFKCLVSYFSFTQKKNNHKSAKKIERIEKKKTTKCSFVWNKDILKCLSLSEIIVLGLWSASDFQLNKNYCCSFKCICFYILCDFLSVKIKLCIKLQKWYQCMSLQIWCTYKNGILSACTCMSVVCAFFIKLL